MKKRIVSILLCLVMLLAVLPVPAKAAGGRIARMDISIDLDLRDGALIPFDDDLLVEADPDLYTAYFWVYSWSGNDGIYPPDAVDMPRFRGGEEYTMMILITPKSGVTGLNEDTASYLPVFINGQRAAYNPACKPISFSDKGVEVYAYNLKLRCPWTSKVGVVDVLGLVPPTPGAVPCSAEDLSLPEGAPYTISQVIWWKYSGSTPSAMASGEKFTEGLYYFANVKLAAKKGYSFASTKDILWLYNGSVDLVDTTNCEASGSTAQLSSSTMQAVYRHVDTVEVSGLGSFIIGEPAYKAAENVSIPAGAGYTLRLDADDRFANHDMNWYIRDNTIIEPGVNYRAIFRVVPRTGWTIDSSTVWYINGSTDNLWGPDQGSGYWYIWSKPMPSVLEKPLDEIHVHGLRCPSIGGSRDDFLKVFTVGGAYDIADAYWYCDTEGRNMYAGETFQKDMLYSLCVRVVPVSPSIIFADHVKFIFNSGVFSTDFSAESSLGGVYGWTKPMKPVDPAISCGGAAEDCALSRFKDAPSYNNWAHEGIEFVVRRGLFGGTTDTTFEPNTTMTRAMFVTVLYRYEGSPKAGKVTFTDVKETAWYRDAVAWASANKIVSGVSDTKFDPNAPVSREQIAMLLLRYAQYKKAATGERADLSLFPDTSSIHSYALDAMSWAVAKGYITGSIEHGTAYLVPRNGATRAQVATILMRFIQDLEK